MINPHLCDIRLIEINRIQLLKELFLLTREEEDVMAFLKSQEVLSESDLLREEAFIEKHQIR